MERLISVFGLFAMVGFAWLLSNHRRRIPWRVVVGGMVLQLVLGLAVLKTEPGRWLFVQMGDVFNSLLDCVDEGSKLMFGQGSLMLDGSGESVQSSDFSNPNAVPVAGFTEHYVAFKVLPTIIFFSALMGILYHLGIVQLVVKGVAWVMQKTLGTSGAESLSAAANIFVGQTEAPLVIRPYIGSMTQSELMSVMVGGFATIAGGVLAAYAALPGVEASHLITASVISAPAALLIAKVLQPEVEVPATLGTTKVEIKSDATNVIEAAGNGAIEGLRLCLNVGAMLIAFVAIMALLNLIVGWCGEQIGLEETWTLQRIAGVFFVPFAWLMGIPYEECFVAGELLSTKMILNEFIAYGDLSVIIQSDKELDGEGKRQLSERSVTIMTYALCGFANFSSIGIQLGGIGGIAPERQSDLAKLGLRAMLGGTLAAFMTACVAGILL